MFPCTHRWYFSRFFPDDLIGAPGGAALTARRSSRQRGHDL